MWNDEPKYCPKCGSPLRAAQVEGRLRPACPACPFVSYRNPASASAAVVVREGCLLLVKRRNDPHRGCWSIPAGYQEIDETPAEAAVREAREETGVEIVIERLLDVLYTSDDPRKPGNLVVFLGRAVGGELRPGDDAEEVRYFSLAALPDRVGFRNDRILLERIRREFAPPA